MNKVIFVMIDAQCYEHAALRAGFLEHLVAEGRAAKYRMISGLPSLSRPMYETLMTGLPACEHGIYVNKTIRPSRCENVFSLTRKNGLVNAAAAYSWFAELYGGCCPYDMYRDRFLPDGSGEICHGIFYSNDDYPDDHVYADAEFLRTTYHPDFLLIHPMGVDRKGHLSFSSASREYHRAVENTFEQITFLLDRWHKDGYDVVVTGDHGMDTYGMHGGDEPIQREVPLYIFSDAVAPGNYTDHTIPNLNIAPLLCRLLGIAAGAQMLQTLDIHFVESN